MLFPKNRLKFRKDHGGQVTPEGFLTLDIGALDLEGVRTIVIPLEEIEGVRNAGDRAADRLNEARKLLGGEE